MITQGMVALVNYSIHLTPGLLLFGAWFALTPRSMTAIRILILLAAFVLMRDAMTPLRMWALSDDVQIAFTANTFVLAALGGLSLLLVAGLAWVAPDLSRLVLWSKGNCAVGLARGLPCVPGPERHSIGLAGVAVYPDRRARLRVVAHASWCVGRDARPWHGDPVDCRASGCLSAQRNQVGAVAPTFGPRVSVA